MSTDMLNFLMLIGGFTILCIFVIMLIMVAIILINITKSLKLKHKIKHRFDKPPTAKCYCKDCRSHRKDGGCRHFAWMTADHWFCWQADPITEERKETNESN